MVACESCSLVFLKMFISERNQGKSESKSEECEGMGYAGRHEPLRFWGGHAAQVRGSMHRGAEGFSVERMMQWRP